VVMPPSFPITTKWQWLLTLTCTRLFGLLSFIGSSLIVYMILSKRKERLARLHNRIILGMSLADALCSAITFVGATAFIPSISPIHYGAIGNKISCNIQGFFTHLLLIVPNYNACLCLQHVGIIRYEIREDVLMKRFEKWMHAYALFPPFLLAILDAVLDSYSPRLLYCWVAPGLSIRIFSVFLLLDVVIICISMWLVYRAVRSTEVAMQQYDFGPRTAMTRRRSQQSGSTDVAKQCFLYVWAVFATYIIIITERFLYLFTRLQKRYFWFILLACIFYPSQVSDSERV